MNCPRVIGLEEIVIGQLPVAIELNDEMSVKDKVLQRKALGIGESRRHEFGQGSSIRIEIDKNQAAPQFAADGQQSRGRLVQTGELMRLGRSKHSAIEVERPCRSEEHTSELTSLMRKSYAIFCWKKK